MFICKTTSMKKIANVSMIILLLLGIGLSGCKKTKEITCSLYAAPSQPAVAMTVVYTAEQTGDGTISSLSYVTNAGTVTVSNPILPWTISISVLSGTNVNISATGTTKNGSLKISYAGEATTGSSTSKISGTDSCEQQTN